MTKGTDDEVPSSNTGPEERVASESPTAEMSVVYGPP